MKHFQRTLIIGGTYKHFKGEVYQVLSQAVNAETQEEMVVYRHWGNYQTFVIPLDTFMSKVDTDKYPDCEEDFRMTYQPDYKTSEEEFKQKSRFR